LVYCSDDDFDEDEMMTDEVVVDEVAEEVPSNEDELIDSQSSNDTSPDNEHTAGS